MNDLALLSVDGPTATISLNRPDAANALSIGLLDALHARVGELEGRDGTRVLVLTGSGRSFCAGMDLKEVLIEEGTDSGSGRRLLESLGDLTLRLRGLPMVTVARINGAAIGGGCGLTCVCDLSVAHPKCKLGFPEVDLGLCPAVVAPWVVRKLGAGRARRLLLTGGLVAPEEALAIGLIDHLAPTPEALDEVVDGLVARLATGGAAALGATKDLLNELDGSMDERAVRRGAELSATVLATPEAQQALRSRAGG